MTFEGSLLLDGEEIFRETRVSSCVCSGFTMLPHIQES